MVNRPRITLSIKEGDQEMSHECLSSDEEGMKRAFLIMLALFRQKQEDIRNGS